MRDFTSNLIKQIKPSGIRKYFDAAREIPGCVSLGVGEPDFVTPKHICDKAIDAINNGETHYTANQGLKELREEISFFSKSRYNLDYTIDETLITCGGSEGVDISLRACIEKDDEVIVLEPSYVSYEPDILLAGGKIKRICLKESNDFKLTKKELEDAITPKTKILLINYPNNPTGAIMTKDDLNEIVPVIIKNDLLVISDEIYCELTYDNNHISIGSLPYMHDRTITINGFSKSFAMTGFRLGWVQAPQIIMEQIKKIHQFLVMSASTISQFAGIEAIKNSIKDIEFMKEEYNKRRIYLYNEFKRLGIPCFEPKGAFYMFPNISKYNKSSDEFCIDILNKEKVLLVPGTAFGESLDGYIRVSYAYSIDNLKIAVSRIEKYINSLKK